ncbi:MAG: 2-C-methyl-D-erythritol 4-phosphate cytidylyltransferase [Victivallales bacterium]|nr:2-C-methyl-D-erythritol 4-phosphate cytidylyltransferase [Victivallales bacterium]
MERIEDLVLIIVAAGTSERFGGREKQLELLGGLPVFLHSVKNLSPLAGACVIAVPQGKLAHYRDVAVKYGFASDKLHFVEGGSSRTASVHNALAKAASLLQDGIVAIHDAARPLASQEMLRCLVKTARDFGGAAPGKEVSDTMLRTDENDNIAEYIPRTGIWHVATPQVFRLQELLNAYNAVQNQAFTDDTQVFLHNGGKVRMLQENACNIKITYQEDLELCRSLLP